MASPLSFHDPPVDLAARLETLARVPLKAEHARHLARMRDAGFSPKVVYDIGSCVMQWTRAALAVWPGCFVVMFDACEALRPMYAASPHAFHIGVLAAEEKKVTFYENPHTPHGNSMYKENNEEFFPPESAVTKTAETLDSVVARLGLPPPDLIKIDVQGGELDVLRGATETLKHAERLIVELQHEEYNRGAPMVDESVAEIERMGFTLVCPRFSVNGADADYEFVRV